MAKSYNLSLTTEEIQTVQKIANGQLAAVEKQLQLKMSDEEQARLFCRAAEFDAIARKIEGALAGVI
jgi:hypothetical protein